MSNREQDISFTLRISTALYKKLEKLAQADDRAVAWMIRRACEEYVAKHKGGK